MEKIYMDSYYKAGLITSFLSYMASYILMLIFFGWKLALIFLLFAMGLSGIIIWHILLPLIYENMIKIDKLKKKGKKKKNE